MAVLKVLCQPNSTAATVEWHGQTYSAVIGKNGVIDPAQKKEGDGCTPLGTYPLIQGFYRADRTPQPNQTFPWQPIQPGYSWNETPTSPAYNQLEILDPATLGEAGMYKTGPQRDVVIVIGYNTNPVVPGKGSALYIHPIPLQGESRGCVMLSLEDTQKIAQTLQPGDQISIHLAQ